MMRKIKIAAVMLVIMCGMLFPAVMSSAASCGEIVSQDTEAVLKAVDYENNETIAAKLAPSRYLSYEVTNKKLEIASRDNRNFLDITDDEAKKELNRENVPVMSFGESFGEVQGEVGQIIQRIVDNTAGVQNQEAASLTSKIVQNKEALLLGLAYIDRLYDFNMGEKNIRDVLLYEPGTYGTQTNVLDWLIKIGNAGGDKLKISNCAKVFGYGNLFYDVTGYSAVNLGAFLELNRQKWIPDMSLDDWFLQESRAFIVEEKSAWDPAVNIGLYSRLYGDTSLQSHILPLLTVSEDSIYVIATSATITYGIVDCYVDRNLKDTDPALYGEKREQFRQDLEHIAVQQRDFIDLWYRIAKPEVRGQLSSNRIVKDSLRIYADTTTTAQAEWSAKFGKEASRGVTEFFAPLNLYAEYMFVDGMADGNGIRYYVSKALTERGLATYAHELTHLLVSPLMLNGYGARDGMQAEVYTRGMFEPYESNDPPVFNLNLIYDRQMNNERFHNADPGRFLDETDMKDYMSGILDVVYTLDYAEAEVMLSKTPEEKKKWFHKLEQIEDTKTRPNPGDEGASHNLDSVRELTLDEAGALNTIDDLIRDSIIVSRYEVNGTKTSGTMASNGYYVVPLFSANYAAVQNDKGVSGDVMIRRQAFELLAEYGYYDGMVPYISNQYKTAAAADQTMFSDTYILKKIFSGTYGTMADFKKAMFQKRIDRIGELKPVTISWENQSVTIRNFETLQQLMKSAVESDLKNVTVMPDGFNNIRAQNTQVERLKAEIFKAYLFQTRDFEESIYGDGQEPVEPTAEPTVIPTVEPTVEPTVIPTAEPTVEPTMIPTAEPTVIPTVEPTMIPTMEPTVTPTVIPTVEPTVTPTMIPTIEPTVTPTVIPTMEPTVTPTVEPTASPMIEPTITPTVIPTAEPTVIPTAEPTMISTAEPTVTPTVESTEEPTLVPTIEPTVIPTVIPTVEPTIVPTIEPTVTPTIIPTIEPTETPTVIPTVVPTDSHQDGNGQVTSEEKPIKTGRFLARVSSARTSQTIHWSSVNSADGYYIYGAKSNAKFKRLGAVSKNICKWKRRSLKKGIQYKYRVAAYKIMEGKRVIISRSLPVYSTTKGGKYGNPVKLRAKKLSVRLKTGKKARLKVKVTGKRLNKARRKVRYICTDTSIARVSKKGVVTGVGRGTCSIYCVARNGLYKKIRVRVR